MTATRALTTACYGLVSLAFLAVGAGVLLADTGLLPAAGRAALAELSGGDRDTLHVLQEFAAVLVFAGLLAGWFAWHYERSRPFHWALTIFWTLFALVHWFDGRGPRPSVVGPLVNTVPVLVFLALGLLRAAADGRSPQHRRTSG